MNEQIDAETRFLAILHLATEAEAGPDGMLPPDVQQAIKSLSGGVEDGAQFSLEESSCEEYFSSEPPSTGWIYCGNFRWIRVRSE